MTTELKQYRKTERLLNDFRNKRITFTEAIDTISEWIKASREEALEEIQKFSDSLNGCPNYCKLDLDKKLDSLRNQ